MNNMSHKKFTLSKINIESDQNLFDEYNLTIPVVRVNGTVVSESVIDIPALRKVLE